MLWKRMSPLAASAAGLVAALVTSGAPALRADDHEPSTCSNRTLRGDYGSVIDGTILLPSPAPSLLLRGLAMGHFDGRGNTRGVDFVTVNGAPESSDWRPTTGTYHVNADCTGTQEILFEDGTTLNLRMVVVDGGRQIMTLVDGQSVGSIGFRVR